MYKLVLNFPTFWLGWLPMVKDWVVITSSPSLYICVYVYEPLVSFSPVLSCLCSKHVDIFIFLPSSDHCIRLASCFCRFRIINMPVFLISWATPLHKIICSQVNKLQADNSMKTAGFLVWGPTWKVALPDFATLQMSHYWLLTPFWLLDQLTKSNV